MVSTNDSFIKNIDWITIAIYVCLVIFGWFSICGASYDYGEVDFFDFDNRTGKQAVWIGFAVFLGFIILMIEEKIYDYFAYFAYGAMMILLFVTPFLATDIKGSLSWIKLGSVSLQPAEFAKFITALTIAKYINTYGFSMSKMKCVFTVVGMVLLPMLLIIMQKETGSALVYAAFFLMLYREGMSGAILFSGVCLVVYFILGIRDANIYMPDTFSRQGPFVVLTLIGLFTTALLLFYTRDRKVIYTVSIASVSLPLIFFSFSTYVIPFNTVPSLYWLCILIAIFLLIVAIHKRIVAYFYIALFTLGSIGFLYSASYVFNNVLEPHQQVRIRVVLGMEEDLKGAGYNVNQSLIAIGSGGLTGKGFLNGTQTKLKYVPEQDTDFIFCTVGEEEGFVGSTIVLLLFLTFILRLIFLAERQESRFSRVYGYSVISIFLFHLFINVGMVLGLTPVIGIPLPFFSYGGSSLWGFTILLFIFLRMDGTRARNR